MDIKRKRKLIEVLRGLVSDGFAGTQGEIVRELKKRGFNVTQATVSRIMKQIGVLKESKGVYRLPSKTPAVFRGSIADLVTGIVHNESILVVKTTAGSAMFVAGFIDHEGQDFILGTVAGDDTIFVAPKNTKDIEKAKLKLVRILRS